MAQFLHFQSSLGRRLVPVSAVVEVIPMVALQHDPADAGDNGFCGLLNFRGEVIPVFSLSPCSPEECCNPSWFLIVTDTGQGKAALLAQEVDYLLDVDDADLSEIPARGQLPLQVARIGQDAVRIVQPAGFLS